MQTTFKIAKNEFRHLFYSPIAWFLSIIFLVMCSFFYTGILYSWAKASYLVYSNKPYAYLWVTDSVTGSIFSNPTGSFFFSILQNIYLFVPLLTMSVINREFNNGTARLLYSSPVKLREIIVGKYLGILAYNILLLLIMGIFIISGFFDITHLDFGLMLSAILGFYLLLSALTAIGFFMSSLTLYQVIAAIASFTVLFILNSVGRLWQQYDFIRDLTYFLSIAGRTEKMLIGLISTKDVLYYLLIIYMFVSFTLIRLKSGQENRPWYVKAFRYLLVAVSVLVIGYISSRPRFTGYLDTTARQENTLHPRTQQIVKALGDSTLEVTLYCNLFDQNVNHGLPAARNIYLSDFWEKYLRFKPDIQFKYCYYYAVPPGDSSLYKTFPGKSLREIAGLVARGFQVDSSLFKSPEAIRRIIDLAPESYRLVMQLKYRGRTTFLRLGLDDMLWPEETNVNAALKRLLQAPIPKVYFVTGQLERNIYKTGEREYAAHATSKRKGHSLLQIGFDPDTLNLAAQDIPADTRILVLADPRMDLPSVVQQKIRNYISQGGNLLVLGEPGKQHVLAPLLAPLGVELMQGQLVQPTANETPDKVWVYYTYKAFSQVDEPYFRQFKRVWDRKIYTDSIKNIFAGVTGIAYTHDSGFTAVPWVLTLPGASWLKAGKLVTDSTAPVYNPAEGDTVQSSFPAIIALSKQLKGREQRVIVCGDADCISNLRLADDLSHAFYSWLCNGEYPVYTPQPFPMDNRVVLSPEGAARQKIIYIYLLPGLLLLAGTMVLVRRKRK